MFKWKKGLQLKPCFRPKYAAKDHFSSPTRDIIYKWRLTKKKGCTLCRLDTQSGLLNAGVCSVAVMKLTRI